MTELTNPAGYTGSSRRHFGLLVLGTEESIAVSFFSASFVTADKNDDKETLHQ